MRRLALCIRIAPEPARIGAARKPSDEGRQAARLGEGQLIGRVRALIANHADGPEHTYGARARHRHSARQPSHE